MASSTAASAASSITDAGLTSRPPTCALSPLKKYSRRCVPASRAAGSVQRAPGCMVTVQIATSDSACAAQESGGDASGAAAPASAPAITATSVLRPPSSACTSRGIRSAQSMVKCGWAILLRAGRFSQIWNSSNGLSRSASSRGNISAWTTPCPAVSHCTSPWPKRAVAPSESEWSIRPLRTMVTVSKPRCGCAGKPGTESPWYMLQPSLRLKSWPIARPASEVEGTPSLPLDFGYASS